MCCGDTQRSCIVIKILQHKGYYKIGNYDKGSVATCLYHLLAAGWSMYFKIIWMSTNVSKHKTICRVSIHKSPLTAHQRSFYYSLFCNWKVKLFIMAQSWILNIQGLFGRMYKDIGPMFNQINPLTLLILSFFSLWKG